MPFDPLGFEDIQVPVVKPFDFDTATPDERLLELAWLLGDDDSWRGKIKWRFASFFETSRYGTAGCALGLAYLLWPAFHQLLPTEFEFDSTPTGRMSKFLSPEDAFVHAQIVFNMNATDVGMIFGRGIIPRGFRVTSVTPGMVATAIRQFVAKRSASPVGERGEI